MTGVIKLLRSLSSVQRIFAALVVVVIASAVAVPAFLVANGTDKQPAEAPPRRLPGRSVPHRAQMPSRPRHRLPPNRHRLHLPRSSPRQDSPSPAPPTEREPETPPSGAQSNPGAVSAAPSPSPARTTRRVSAAGSSRRRSSWQPRGQTEVVCQVESMYGFSGPVSLGCVPDMRNVSCAGTANPVTPPPHGSADVAFRVAVPKENQAGNYRFVINHSAPGAEPVSRIPFVFYVRVTRPTLDVSCSPRDLVVQQGGHDRLPPGVTGRLRRRSVPQP